MTRFPFASASTTCAFAGVKWPVYLFFLSNFGAKLYRFQLPGLSISSNSGASYFAVYRTSAGDAGGTQPFGAPSMGAPYCGSQCCSSSVSSAMSPYCSVNNSALQSLLSYFFKVLIVLVDLISFFIATVTVAKFC